MSIAAMDPNSVRSQSNQGKKGVTGQDVAVAVGSTNPFASTMAGLGSGDYKAAAVTSAAISGVAGVPGAMHAQSNGPYFYGASSGLSGGYLSTQFGGFSTTDPVTGAPLAPSPDFQEKAAILEATKDANWEMLVLQVTVNEISRDYQARSNILKTKSDTELNAVRNMRA